LRAHFPAAWLLAFLATIAGCSSQDSPRSQCVDGFLKGQSELRNGIAVFNDGDGRVIESTADLTARFRVIRNADLPAASLSKTITAHNVRTLIDAGVIGLESRVGDVLPAGKQKEVDAAHADIRVRQLLQHASGFDRAIGGDPLWQSDGLSPPQANCRIAANRILHTKFDFQPGQRVAYSNAGYCVLGEVLLANAQRLSPTDKQMLIRPLGAAGGWVSAPATLHARLLQTLPLRHIEGSVSLPDGSHYDFGWRHWPRSSGGPPWTHFGRLPGIMTVAVSDGRKQLLVAYFDGDPANVDLTSANLARDAWKCMQLPH
jgi:CubicO group peptidase (beta-lactamase class C family)